MDYEKKYKNAIKSILEWREKYGFTKLEQYILEGIFSELKESDNTDIRTEIKNIITYFYGSTMLFTHLHSKEELLTWLEKQGDIDNKFIRMRETKPKDISEFLDRLTTVEQEFLWEHIAKIRELNKEKQGEQKYTAEEVLIKAGLKPYKDGDQWCVLLGDNIQEGICGFGNTIEDALYAFLKDLIASQGEQKSQGKSALEAAKEEKVDNLHNYLYCEQKPADIPEDFEKYVEHLLSLSDGEGHGSPAKVKEVSSELLRLANQQKTAWNDEDEKMFDVVRDLAWKGYKDNDDNNLPTFGTIVDWLKSIKNRVLQLKQTWSEEDDFHYTRLENFLEVKEHEANSSQYQSEVHKTLKWLKSLRPQPKYEWTEKDEINRDLIYNALNHVYDLEHNKSLCDWLNSLRPQNGWKPSDEQMRALDIALKAGIQLGTWEEKALRELKEQLKKLKE